MAGLDALLSPARVICRAEAASKKRIFELAAKQIAAAETSLEEDEVFNQLIAREKLGSTGLGRGVAIPHCRVEGCTHPIGCLITLDSGVDFESPDGRPVDLLFVLLVPPEATQTHLDLLAELARRFSSDDYCQRLRNADSDAALLDFAMSVQAL